MSEEEKRKRSEYKVKRQRRILFLSVLILLATVFTAVAGVIYYRLDKTYYIEYDEKGAVDYKVYLKENEFFEEEFLGSGQAYVASLIKNVKADFSYAMLMDATNVSFDYSYKIDTVLRIKDKDSGGTFFERTYNTLPETKHSVASIGNLNINESVDIDYVSYNDLAARFIDTYDVKRAESSLVVNMQVKVLSACEDFEENAVNVYNVSLTIPLTLETVNINMTSTVPSEESRILACDRAENKDVFLIAAISGGGFDLLLILLTVVYVFLSRNKDINYAIKVKKLLSAYKSFIQRLVGEFDASGYQVLEISSFNEMLDIRDTIQSPILMSENADQTMTRFLIPTQTKLLYVFDVKVEGYDEIYGIKDPEDEIIDISYTAEEIAPVEETPEIVEEATVPIEDVIVPLEEVADPVEEIVAVTEEFVLPDEGDGEDGADFRNGIKYDYSFLAKLILASEETREYYKKLVAFIKSYGVKVSRSWKRERVYFGRRQFASLIFKGTRLGVALALDPKAYEDSKYTFTDLSGTKRYEKTPMLFKLTSDRQLKHVTELLEEMFIAEGLADKSIVTEAEVIPYKSKRELVLEGLIRTEVDPHSVDDTKREAPAPAVVQPPVAEPMEEIVIIPEEPMEEATSVADFRNGIKYDYSFEAKLILAKEETKEFYNSLTGFIRASGVKIVRSWKRERIYLGRKLFAILSFKGSRLSVALALNPADYENTKYRGEDVSAIKKFATTPMLIRLSSPRRLKYVKELLDKMFTDAGISERELPYKQKKIPTKGKRALLNAGLIKVSGKSEATV